MHASHGTPGQQLLEKLQSVSPVQLDGEVVVLSFMFVFPAALYYAGRILIWDYKVCSLQACPVPQLQHPPIVL